MTPQEVPTVPTTRTKVEKAILAYFFLEGAFTADLALISPTVIGALGLSEATPTLQDLCVYGYLHFDEDEASYWLSPMGNLYVGVLLGSLKSFDGLLTNAG